MSLIMRGEQMGRARGPVGQLHGEAMEQQEDLGLRHAHGAGAEQVQVDEAGESRHCGRENARARARSSVRAASGQHAHSAMLVQMIDAEDLADGTIEQQASRAVPSEDGSSPKTMEKWALDNAPPPIKVRRGGETSEESSPKELCPPPSPKRMRELYRKASIHELPFSKVFTQSSV